MSISQPHATALDRSWAMKDKEACAKSRRGEDRSGDTEQEEPSGGVILLWLPRGRKTRRACPHLQRGVLQAPAARPCASLPCTPVVCGTRCRGADGFDQGHRARDSRAINSVKAELPIRPLGKLEKPWHLHLFPLLANPISHRLSFPPAITHVIRP